MTSKITIILSYYNQAKEVLIRHIDNWKQFTNINEFTFFIIDDCSKIPVNKLLEDCDLSNLDLHLYRVEEDLYCNIAGVRNLGAQECNTPYMVILDMDTVINNEMSNKLLLLAEKNINRNNVYKFNRLVPTPDGLSFQTKHKKHNKPHPAVCLIRKKDYLNGKFTLAFVGYGSEKDNTVIELTYNWGIKNITKVMPLVT